MIYTNGQRPSPWGGLQFSCFFSAPGARCPPCRVHRVHRSTDRDSRKVDVELPILSMWSFPTCQVRLKQVSPREVHFLRSFMVKFILGSLNLLPLRVLAGTFDSNKLHFGPF